ncbi:MAG: helix-hairpin-helix domain-containing protein [Lachnospiraceae bacterium]|nr:helix-hairpin-helix domain-containing protein [Lachnospiraceae bacterium]
MNRKKKKIKIITTIGILLFFFAGGLWYIRQKSGEVLQQEQTRDVQSIFVEQNKETGTTPMLTPGTEKVSEAPVLVVYICGAVNNPGVYTLSVGSRLYEAVAMAGGFSAEADPFYHNLARTLEDGERIYIISYAETKEMTVQQKADGEDGEGKDTAGGPINLNTATKEQLMTLSGIGEARAESILEYREKVGEFTDIEEIMNISGIGEAMFAKIRDKITVK